MRQSKSSLPLKGGGKEKAGGASSPYRAIALAQRQGFSPDNVPPAGQRVEIALTANISTGGTSVDCTDQIHAYNVAIAEQAAQVVGLDLAGIDLIAPDISKPVLETGGAICEVNGGPGLFVVHSQPVEGKPREVIRPVIDHLFPTGAQSRIPIVAVTGTKGTTTTSRIISHVLELAGHHGAEEPGIDVQRFGSDVGAARAVQEHHRPRLFLGGRAPA